MWVRKYRSRIADQHRKLGASADWSRNTFTLDDGVRQDPSADAATHAGEAFGKRFDREDRIVETGITTLYASSSRGAIQMTLPDLRMSRPRVCRMMSRA